MGLGGKLQRPGSRELRSIMVAWGRQQAALSDETTRLFMDMDLTMAQFRALATIHRRGRLTGRDLARHLRVTPGTLVPLCDRLEEQGYLRRVPDLQDRRLTWLEITPRGERIFQRLFRAGAIRFMGAIARLQPGERKTFERLLNLITHHLETRTA
jgi:DNA-binding MarR family transcriptional regulator